jgi:hypothetical protein
MSKMISLLRFFATACFAVFFVLPVVGQDSEDRFGIEKFGFEKESQIVEQARKAAAQETIQRNTELQQKLRNQISELGRQKVGEQRYIGAFYTKTLKEEKTEKEKELIIPKNKKIKDPLAGDSELQKKMIEW